MTIRTFTDRSRIITYQTCPRKRWLEYHAAGTGVTLARQSVPLATGTFTHLGLAALLNGEDTDSAVVGALAAYDQLVSTRGLELEPAMDAFQLAQEQKALVEALLRVFVIHPRGLPHIHANYDILEVEREDVVHEFAPGIDFGARADGLLREKSTGDLYVLSFKTAARWDSRVDRQNQHDVQGLSEVMAIERRLGERVQGVLLVYLIKGDRSEYPDGSGIYVQQSHLVRGWRREGITGQEFAWRYKWEGPDVWPDTGRLRGHTLGKGWERFNVWEANGGVKAWIDLLATGAVQPDAGDPLDNVLVTPLPYFRQQSDMDTWVRQTQAQETQVAQDVAAVEAASATDLPLMLDTRFIQHRRSCDWPSVCEFQGICFGDPTALVNPLGTGLYQRRVPNHATETEVGDEGAKERR